MKAAALVMLSLGLATGLNALAVEAQVSTAAYPLPTGGRVSVENVRGAIQVEGWDRSVVELTAVKTAPEDCGCLDEAQVVALPVNGGWSFFTLYTGETREPVRVDYRLRVPRQVRLDRLRTVQGEIVVQGVEGRVAAETLNGDIRELDVAGHASARSLNGNIEVSLRALPDSGSGLSFEAINGSLDLVLPPSSNADLELSTVAGKIESPYALQVSSVPGDRVERKRLGRGGISIVLRTVRGNVRLSERPEIL